ncbi:4'-phosphopantetheinyl transferase superfamily protein, partial [Nonomuraea sp. RK-328]|nr:4'-phosphopantetheinyl transferase superfamily protein [Nonomuraea sp. RK-328]
MSANAWPQPLDVMAAPVPGAVTPEGAGRSAVLVGESAVLVGVDVVEVARLARAVERGGAVFARHVTTEAERGLTPEAVAFSVKECLIKAVGGRAAGFGWHDFEAVAGAPAAWARRLLDEAAAELAASTGVTLDGSAAYALRGASHAAALKRLRPADLADADLMGTSVADAGLGDASPADADLADAGLAGAYHAGAHRAGVGSVAGAARWGSGGGLFVALAIVYVDRKGSARCPR